MRRLLQTFLSYYTTQQLLKLSDNDPGNCKSNYYTITTTMMMFILSQCNENNRPFTVNIL